SAAAEAVEAARFRVDDEARVRVVVEGAAAAEVGAAATQGDAVTLHDRLDRVLLLDLLDVVVGHLAVTLSRSASSAGSVVTSECSIGLASTRRAMWLPRAKNRPSPFRQDRRNSRSPALRRKVWDTASMVELSWRISSCTELLARTVWPSC